MIGFTGVNWDTRPTEQLAADLGVTPYKRYRIYETRL